MQKSEIIEKKARRKINAMHGKKLNLNYSAQQWTSISNAAICPFSAVHKNRAVIYIYGDVGGIVTLEMADFIYYN